jgi:UMF1 family MFS transporter
MALFPASALNPGVRKREVFGWAMYDFANSGYTTVVITAVFAAYFVGGIAGAPWAAFAWTAALSISYAIVMVTMPAIGAWADQRAAKKRVLASQPSAACWPPPRWRWPRFSGPSGVALAMALIIVSNAFYSTTASRSRAPSCPSSRTAEGMGKVSGWGWSFGYVGGMLALGICLAYVLWSQIEGACRRRTSCRSPC